MKTFRYYKFTRQAVWKREAFDIEAETKKQADVAIVNALAFDLIEPWTSDIIEDMTTYEDGIGSYFIEDEECKVVSRGVEA